MDEPRDTERIDELLYSELDRLERAARSDARDGSPTFSADAAAAIAADPSLAALLRDAAAGREAVRTAAADTESMPDSAVTRMDEALAAEWELRAPGMARRAAPAAGGPRRGRRPAWLRLVPVLAAVAAVALIAGLGMDRRASDPARLEGSPPSSVDGRDEEKSKEAAQSSPAGAAPASAAGEVAEGDTPAAPVATGRADDADSSNTTVPPDEPRRPRTSAGQVQQPFGLTAPPSTLASSTRTCVLVVARPVAADKRPADASQPYPYTWPLNWFYLRCAD